MRAWRAPLAAAVAATGVLLVLAPRYGWHRDELYFRASGLRLAWGYVDQPPFTPAVARVAHELFGDSLSGLRGVAAVAIGVVVLLAAAIARELGGDGRAQTIAAVVTATTPLFLGMGHLLSTATFDVLWWTVILLLVVRLLRTEDTRLWFPIGAAIGVGFLNKHAVALLAAALLLGFVVVPSARRLLATPKVAAGAVIALVMAAPNVIWHATNDWPVLEMMQSLSDESATEDHILFIPTQLVQTGAAVVLWLAGIAWLLRGRFRPVAIAYLALVVAFVATGAKPYYLAGAYPTLIAAGAVPQRRFWSLFRRDGGKVTRSGRSGGAESGWSWGIGVIAAVGLLAAAVVALPVPSIGWQRSHPIEDLEYEVGAQLGWREMAEVVASEVDALPADEAGAVSIYTQNYGEAGAIDFYGSDLGLPRAASPHNSYWWWGPPRDAGVTVVIGVPDDWLADLEFDECERVHTFDAPRGVLSEETGRSVQMCRGHRVPWTDLWDDLKFIHA